jgi:hypothetical protein
MALEDQILKLTEALGRVAIQSNGAVSSPLFSSSSAVVNDSSAAEVLKETRSPAVLPGMAQFDRLVESLQLSLLIQQEQTRTLDQNTSALQKGDNDRGESFGSVISNTASSYFGDAKSRFLLGPIIGGILGLFGGGKPDPPPRLPTYSLPPAIQLEAGYTGSSSSYGSPELVDHNQNGLPRVIQADRGAQQITVQVQAFDSRSFLDHSEEIARAVREAVLNSHSLNDIVNEI